MQFLLLLLGAGAVWYYGQAKQFQSSYKITLDNGSFNYDKTSDAAFARIYFSIKIQVSNPTAFTGSLQGAKFYIYYNNNNLGYVSITNPVTVIPNGITKIEIPVAVPTTALINSVQEIITAISQQKSIVFNIDGALQFAIGTLTVKTAYKVPLTY